MFHDEHRSTVCALSTLGVLAALATACGDSRAPALPESGNAPETVCTVAATELGNTPLRRLTRFEYGRTLAALTGADPAVASVLPPDERSLGFDDIADAHSISTLHAAKYLELADEVAGALLDEPDRLSAFAGCDPSAGAACVEQFVRSFGRRAFRRALEDEEVTAMLALYAATAEPTARDGLSAVMSAILQAPQFLYRIEPSAAGNFGSALATRLSYLVTATAPDDALLAAAEQGELESETGLLAQADRLFSTPQASDAFAHFMLEWWNLEDLSTLEKDRNLYRAWTDALPAAFATETRSFIQATWSEGPTLARFLSAPYTYVDGTLAEFYGIPGVSSLGYQRVALDRTRASGLLTQGAFLATEAKANQTSPVQRGKFVRERLFCTPPPPPPPDIVVRPPVVDPRLSTRERFAAHTAEPRCAACHVLMDPIGFTFEHYDATGRYRDTDASKPVDASGELTETDVDRTLDGVPSLAAALLESDEVRTCVATQWFRYAFGRQEAPTSGDACTIAALSSALSASGGDLRAAMRATVQSQLFREQRREESAP